MWWLSTKKQAQGRRCWPKLWPRSATRRFSTSPRPVSWASGGETLKSWFGSGEDIIYSDLLFYCFMKVKRCAPRINGFPHVMLLCRCCLSWQDITPHPPFSWMSWNQWWASEGLARGEQEPGTFTDSNSIKQHKISLLVHIQCLGVVDICQEDIECFWLDLCYRMHKNTIILNQLIVLKTIKLHFYFVLLRGDHEGSRRMKTELLVQMDGLARSNDLVFVLAASNLPWWGGIARKLY